MILPSVESCFNSEYLNIFKLQDLPSVFEDANWVMMKMQILSDTCLSRRNTLTTCHVKKMPPNCNCPEIHGSYLSQDLSFMKKKDVQQGEDEDFILLFLTSYCILKLQFDIFYV